MTRVEESRVPSTNGATRPVGNQECDRFADRSPLGDYAFPNRRIPLDRANLNVHSL